MSLQNTMKALADPTRRTILNLLKKSRLSAGEIAENFDISLPAVSKHLTILKDADLIRDYRDGKYIFYELNASVLDEALLWIKDLRSDWYEKILILFAIHTIVLFSAMQFFFQYKAINYTNKPLSLDALKFVTIMIGLFQIVFGNIMPKLRINSFIGLRTSWSMAND